jgi:5-methylcytosine-specific restriction endonuclease McrA
MSYLGPQEVQNGGVTEYHFWFSCDECGEEIFEGWPHWSNATDPDSLGPFVGPLFIPPQADIERVHGDEHYCMDCAFRKRLISETDYATSHGVGVPCRVVIDDDDQIIIELIQEKPSRSTRATRKKAEEQSPRSISKSTRFDVLTKCNFRCVYCGVPATETKLQIDHVKPVSKGGGKEMDNLVAACFDCNQGKKAKEI